MRSAIYPSIIYNKAFGVCRARRKVCLADALPRLNSDICTSFEYYSLYRSVCTRMNMHVGWSHNHTGSHSSNNFMGANEGMWAYYFCIFIFWDMFTHMNTLFDRYTNWVFPGSFTRTFFFLSKIISFNWVL
jgi:hypothetical protein